MRQPEKTYQVIVLGAGAAGLLCAITAAQRGRRVLVLEKANKPGKKILMSGGGRCNFTNLSVEPENFLSDNPHFCKAALKRYTPWDFIALVQRHGIEYEERKHGQLFCKHSAKEIVAMLLEECKQAGVEVLTQSAVTAVEKLADPVERCNDAGNRYRVAMLHGKGAARQFALECQSLVVATGALSVPTLGGSAMGYEIAERFGLALAPRRAALVPFVFSGALKPVCERLAGLSVDVTASANSQSFSESLLFTHRGMSGPVILQLSNYWQPGDEVFLDLLPGTDAGQWLLHAKQQEGKIRMKSLLQRRLPRALVGELLALWWPDAESAMATARLAEIADRELIAAGRLINRWAVKPSGTEGYRTAEVTLGGVATDALSSRTMEARQHPGLFFVGEVLDVTGHLGGFNFQWAWSSGYSAGLVV